MRHIPPKATFRPDNGILKAVDGSDEHAVRWFDMIQLTRKSNSRPELSRAFVTNVPCHHQPISLRNAEMLSSIPPTHALSIAPTVPIFLNLTTQLNPEHTCFNRLAFFSLKGHTCW